MVGVEESGFSVEPCPTRTRALCGLTCMTTETPPGRFRQLRRKPEPPFFDEMEIDGRAFLVQELLL